MTVDRKAVAMEYKLVAQLDDVKVVLLADLRACEVVGWMEFLKVVLWAVVKVADTAAMMAK